ncbi:S-adenosyl-L-methionine-dependent methyltransferase [Streptomyces azureus]|uniref:S-adenosyl-L-methionine-dependent methyltransferase n=1 Tax=Streptomyces azureus TaxID=146537 RepID=A0A0K8PCN3_STRAJ|nr:S-adenosyl-L-methionine-dependent methyltransferase [Streptomyces azureus]
MRFRSRADVARFFDGLELLDPGVTVGHRWRPGLTDGDAPTDAEVSLWTGVGTKP